MTSPARRHYLKKMAEEETKAAAENGIRPNASEYELLQAKLYEDTRRLKDISSIKSKVALKIEMLPEYGPYIAGVLASDAGAKDDVLMTLMIWLIDAANYGGAMEIARYAIKHGLSLPDKFERSTACAVADEIADASLKGDPVNLDILQQLLALCEGQDIPDQVSAKIHKAIGLQFEESEPAKALEHFNIALSFDDKSGVKTTIKKLKKLLEEKAKQTTPANPG